MENLIYLSVLFINMVFCSSETKEIESGEGIRHDDFQYIVSSYAVSKQIGSVQAANKNYYMVHFKVVNNAVRVSHSWDNAVAYLTDEQGNVYENQPLLQAELQKVSPFNLKDRYITQFQTSDTTVFVFEVPKDIKNPYLMVRGETLMGDFFDGNQFRKTKVKLFD